jgi:hypothetical protein
MTPELIQLQNEIQALRDELNNFYAAPQFDPRFATAVNDVIVSLIAQSNLGDLADVDTSGASSGQVLEYNGTSWVPATDNT